MPGSRRRAVLLLVTSVLGAVAVLAGVLAWQAWRVSGALQGAVDDGQALRASLETGTGEGVDDALDRLQRSSERATELSSGPLWRIATWLPVVGDDAAGVRSAAAVIADLSSEDGLAPLIRTADDLDRLAPRDGRVDLEAVESLNRPVVQAAEALAEARAILEEEDPSSFVQRFRGPFRDLQEQVYDGAATLESAAVATEILPEALGADGPRSYLLVFQNNAELRATGGLPGAMAVVRAEDGQLTLGRQASASSFGERSSPVLPLSAGEKKIWGNIVGTYAQNANFSPDWPRAADLLRARWEETYPERFDGVVTLDTVAVSYLLGVTGPVQVAGYDISAESAVDVLLNQVYLDIADPRAQDALFQQVASAVFDQFRSGQVDRPRDLLSALRTATDEGRLFVNFVDDEEQAQIADRRIAGATSDSDGVSDRFDVTLLDGTGSKMSYYVRYGVRSRAVSCSGGVGRYEISATVRSDAPQDAAGLPRYITGGGDFGVPAGTAFTQVRVFTPSGGRVTGMTVNGAKINVLVQDLGGRSTASGSLFLEPGDVQDVEWQVEMPAGASSYPVRVTPGLEDEDESGSLRAACG